MTDDYNKDRTARGVKWRQAMNKHVHGKATAPGCGLLPIGCLGSMMPVSCHSLFLCVTDRDRPYVVSCARNTIERKSHRPAHYSYLHQLPPVLPSCGCAASKSCARPRARATARVRPMHSISRASESLPCQSRIPALAASIALSGSPLDSSDGTSLQMPGCVGAARAAPTSPAVLLDSAPGAAGQARGAAVASVAAAAAAAACASGAPSSRKRSNTAARKSSPCRASRS